MHKSTVYQSDGKVVVYPKDMGDLVARGKEEHYLYRLSALLVHNDSHSKLWHERLVCMEGKQHRINFPKEATFRATEPVELVHFDICGPMPTISMGGLRFSLLLLTILIT